MLLQESVSVTIDKLDILLYLFFVLFFLILAVKADWVCFFLPIKGYSIGQVSPHHFYGPFLWTDMPFHLHKFYDDSLESELKLQVLKQTQIM